VRTIGDFMKSPEYGYYILDGEVSVECCTWDCVEVQHRCTSVLLSMGASTGGLVVTII